jgi:colanic acid biosynthesis glycosyl transferase WcaI
MKSRRFVLINQFYPPAQAPTGRLLRDLALELVGRGHAVTVLASAAGYGAEAGADGNSIAGVRVVRIGPVRRHRTGIPAKFLDYLAFHCGVRAELARESVPPDALVCMTTPPFIGLQAARYQKRRGVPYVLWCMDLYPEALRALGGLHPWNPVIPLLRAAARAERRSASVTVALGPDMAGRLAASGAERIVEIPVWSRLVPTAELADAARQVRRARGWAADEIVLLYSGNMGRAHRAEEFAELAGLLRAAGIRARFVFAGIGPRKADWATRWGGRFEFMPPVPDGEAAAHLAAADVHLVSQQPGWEGVVVPSKFQAACALGKPVVFAGPPRSAVGGWLAESDAGWGLAPGQSPAGAVAGLGDAAVREAKGRRARALFERCFTPAVNCVRMLETVENSLRPSP